jgi:hypothetical protein
MEEDDVFYCAMLVEMGQKGMHYPVSLAYYQAAN